MLKYILCSFLIALTSALCSQSLVFLTIGDGACNYKTEFGYMRGVVLEVNAETIDTLYCNNGTINKVESYFLSRFQIMPKKLGDLKVTLVSDGDTIASQIEIIPLPKLTLVVHQQGDSIRLNLVNPQGKVVTKQFYTVIEATLKSKSSDSNFMFGNILNGNSEYWITLDYFRKTAKISDEQLFLVFQTTAIYSKKSCQYVGSSSCSIKTQATP